MGWFSDSPKISQLVEVNLGYKPGSLHQSLFLKLRRVLKVEEKMAPGPFVPHPRECGYKEGQDGVWAAVLPPPHGAAGLEEPPAAIYCILKPFAFNAV